MKTNFLCCFIFLLGVHSFGTDRTESPQKPKRSPITRGGLSISRMEELVNEGAAKIDTVTEKNIVLVLGNTGAGKSATINYLLGAKAKNTGSFHRPTVTYINPLDEKAKLGQSCAESETTFPYSYENIATSAYNYCDTPGFFDSRGKDEVVVVATSTKAAIKRAGEIKAITVVIDYNTIRTDKASGLVKLSQQLAKLIKNPQKLYNSILFIITKAPGITLEDLKKDIDDIKKARNKEGQNLLARLLSFLQFQNAEQKEETERELEASKQVLSILDLFELSNYKNVSIVDIFDNFNSKSAIEKKIEMLDPLPISSFNFNDYDTESTKFDEALIQIVEDKIFHIDTRNKIARNIEDNNNRILDLTKSIADHMEAIKSLDEFQQIDEEARSQKKKNLEKQIREKQEHIAKMEGARIFYLEKLPETNLEDYRNSFIIVSNRKVPVYYVNKDSVIQKLTKPHRHNYLHPIIKETEGKAALTHTLPQSESSFLLRNYSSKHLSSKNVYFLKDIPSITEMKNYKNQLIFTNNDQNKLKFYTIDDDGNAINIAKNIPPYFRNKLGKFKFIKKNTELNKLLSNVQLMSLYAEIFDNQSSSNFSGTIKLLGSIIGEIKHQRKELLSEKEVLLWRDEIIEERSFAGWLLKYQTKKKFEYTGQQSFIRHEENPAEDFSQIIAKPEAGTYSSLYQSKPSQNGNAEVKIYIQEKDLPANIALKKILDEELERYIHDLNVMNKKISELNKGIEALETALSMYDNEGRTLHILKLKRLIEENNKEITKLKSEVAALQKKLERSDKSCENSVDTLSNCFFYATALGSYSKTFYVKAMDKFDNYNANRNKSSNQFASIFDLHKSLSNKYDDLNVSNYKEKVLEALKSELNPHEIDAKGSNIIHHLIQDGLEKLLPFYHSQEVSLTIQNAQGESPLFTAVRLGNLAALEQFERLNIGLSEQIMPDGNTLLHYALSNSKKGIFAWLLHKVPKNKVNKAGLTALHVALQQRDDESTKLLLEAGGVEISRDDELIHYNALHKAIESNNVAAVKLMVEHADKDVLKQALNTPFSQAKYNHLFVEKNGNNPSQISSDGEWPLGCAVKKGNKQIVAFLLGMHGPHENLDANRNNILHIAAHYADDKILELLWQHLGTTLKTSDAKRRYINQYNKVGFAPIHLAIEKKNMSAMNWFLHNELVDKDKLTKDGKKHSLVHAALATKDEAIAEKLIEANDMPLRLKNSSELTPLEFAKHMEMSKSRALIKDKILTPFLQSIRRYLDEKLKLLNNPALKEHERAFLINEIIPRISYYLKQDNEQAQELKKLILRKAILHDELDAVSHRFLNEFTKILAGSRKTILFKNLQSKSYSQIDDMLPSCFKPLLSFGNEREEASTRNPKGLLISEQEVHNLKKKGFCRALGQSLHYLYYVHYALVEGEVDPKSGNFSSAQSVYSAFSPLIANKVSQVAGDSVGAMQVGLAFSLINGFFLLVREYEKQQAINAAQRVVDAFGSGIMIDVDSIKAITEAFYERYKDQIHQMSMSISTSKKLRLHHKDGVVQFANVIAMRIGRHILQGRNEIIGESNIAICRAFLSFADCVEKCAKKVFGEVQNLTAEKPMPPLQRCMLAIWNESDGLDKKVELDAIEGGKNKIWMAGSILTQTGYRLLDDHKQCYARKGYFDKDIGFCYVTMEEVKNRGDYEEVAAPIDFLQHD